jgi:hypothetical protein
MATPEKHRPAHWFKKGQSGNPRGMPALPHYLKEIKPILPSELIRIVSKYLRMEFGKLSALEADYKELDKLSAVDATIVKFLIQSINEGDWKKMDFLFNRCGLKIKDVVEIETKVAKDEDLGGLDSDTIVTALKSYKKSKDEDTEDAT